jgi:hypothetical protein
VTDGSEKHTDADGDRESNQSEQADGYEKSSEDLPSAIGDCQHGGHSVLAAGTPRNITEVGYGWAKVYPKVRASGCRDGLLWRAAEFAICLKITVRAGILELCCLAFNSLV